MRLPFGVRLSRRGFLRTAGLALGGSLVRSSPCHALASTGPVPDFGSLTLEQQVGQLVIARLQDWPLMERYARQGLISGMTPSLTKASLPEVAEFTNRFQRLSPIPLLFGWGGHSYSGWANFRLNQAMRLGATRNAELCRQAARIEALQSRAVGFHLASTPNLDVNLNPDNTIINLRSLGDDVDLVIRLGSELARGTIEGGTAPVFMHFPGHGAACGDSHIEMPEVARSLAELQAVELKTFAELIRRGLARVICTNHCYYPALETGRRIPATLSRSIITGLLRERLGYTGVIMSDSLTMRPIKENYGIEEPAIEAVAAGHDLILQDYQSDPKITIDALARAVRQGRIPRAQIEQSVRRVWDLKRELGLFQERLVKAEAIPQAFNSAEAEALVRRIARESVTVLECRDGALRAAPGQEVLVVSNGSADTIEQDMAVKHSPTNHRLNRQIQQRMPEARTLVLSTGMRPEEIDAAWNAVQKAQVVVFGLFTRVRSYVKEAIRLAEPYRRLIERAAGAGQRVALLNFGNPYVLAHLPRAGWALCTFSDAEESIDAAVQVLCGEIQAQGKLPVRISDSYPFGYGLPG